MKRMLMVLVAACLLGNLAPGPVDAAVNVERRGSENPMQEVAKSTIYGGLTGLILGSALALAINGDNGGDIIKWSFVGGTFFGFAYGLYHVQTRPRADALLEIEDGAPRLGSLTPEFAPNGEARLHLVGVRF